MKLIKPSFEILPQSEGLDGIYKQIEIAGRTCYKSEDAITETSAKQFVDRLIKSGHGAMLEHGTVYLTVVEPDIEIETKEYDFDDLAQDITNLEHEMDKFYKNKYSTINYQYNPDGASTYYVTTNFRVLVENNWLHDLRYVSEPTEYHEKRVTVKFTMDRIGSQSFCRHRNFSFAQESTRYCNYSKDRFGNELTFIIPNWNINTSNGTIFGTSGENSIHNTFELALLQSEKNYFNLLNEGWSPQQARSVLPNSLKTELVMTGFINDWKGFFKLRTSESAHPQARELAIPLQEWFQQNNLI